MTRILQAGRRLACGGLWLKEHFELARSLSRCCDWSERRSQVEAVV